MSKPQPSRREDVQTMGPLQPVVLGMTSSELNLRESGDRGRA